MKGRPQVMLGLWGDALWFVMGESVGSPRRIFLVFLEGKSDDKARLSESLLLKH